MKPAAKCLWPLIQRSGDQRQLDDELWGRYDEILKEKRSLSRQNSALCFWKDSCIATCFTGHGTWWPRRDKGLQFPRTRVNFRGVRKIVKTIISLLYMFFWVFPRRQIVVGRRFGTLCQFHLQRLGVEYEVWEEAIFKSRRKFEIKITSFVIYVRLSVRTEPLGCHRTDSHQIWYLSIFWNCRENSSFIKTAPEYQHFT